MNRLDTRDREYIEDRLSAPASNANEAYLRMHKLGYKEEAARLMAATRAFQDACRQIRLDLIYGKKS